SKASANFSREMACGFAVINFEFTNRTFTALDQKTLGFRKDPHAGTVGYYIVKSDGAWFVNEDPSANKAFARARLEKSYPTDANDGANARNPGAVGTPANDVFTQMVIVRDFKWSLANMPTPL